MQLPATIACFSVLLWMTVKRLRAFALSPIYALLAVYLVIFVVGSFAYDPNYGGAGATLLVSGEESRNLSEQVLCLLCAFMVGALLSGVGKRAKSPRRPAHWLRFKLTNSQSHALLSFGALALLMEVFGSGAGNIYHRIGYEAQTIDVLKMAGGALLPAAVLALGAASTCRNSLVRAAAIALTASAILITMSLSTRIFCTIPALFFAGGLAIKSDRKSLKVLLSVSCIAAPLLTVVPLTGRGMHEQGLSTLPELVKDILQADVSTQTHEVVNNLFVASPIAAASIRTEVEDSAGYVILGVNPLPGFMTNWATAQRRINRATPFSAVGDLLRPGTAFGMCYFFAIGLYFGHVERRLRATRGPTVSSLATLGLLALSYLFTIVTLQYPLRNSTRLIYYMILLEVITTAFKTIRLAVRDKARNSYTRTLEMRRPQLAPQRLEQNLSNP